jgi:SAM-dependent methyltransferase
MNNGAWKQFDSDAASSYLQNPESREQRAREKVVGLISELANSRKSDGFEALNVLELGCGNGERFGLVDKTGMPIHWTGIDISPVLISAATKNFPDQLWIVGDAEFPEKFLTSCHTIFDVSLFCHVIEMLESPELALSKAAVNAKTTIIEFFEPPADRSHRTEIGFLSENGLPYLRHSIGMETYLTWIKKAGYKNLTVYKTFGKYEVHVLSTDKPTGFVGDISITISGSAKFRLWSVLNNFASCCITVWIRQIRYRTLKLLGESKYQFKQSFKRE